jgi:hypothetical protein
MLLLLIYFSLMLFESLDLFLRNFLSLLLLLCSDNNFAMLVTAVILSFLAFCSGKPGKQKPKKPSPIGKNDNSDFDYCGYYNLMSGERCGDQAGNSFCISDVEGNPACVVSVWCYNLHQSCFANTDCPKDMVCGNTCGNGNQCNPLCGNQELPFDPLYDDEPYYSDSYRCYDQSDVPTGETPLGQEPDPSDTEGRSYSSFMKGLETPSQTNFLSFPRSGLFVFLTLMVVLIVGTFSILRFRDPLAETHHFQEISTSDLSQTQRFPIVELEPPLRSRGTPQSL